MTNLTKSSKYKMVVVFRYIIRKLKNTWTVSGTRIKCQNIAIRSTRFNLFNRHLEYSESKIVSLCGKVYILFYMWRSRFLEILCVEPENLNPRTINYELLYVISLHEKLYNEYYSILA